MRLREVMDGKTDWRSEGSMAMRSRAAMRLCQKSNMGSLYQQRRLAEDSDDVAASRVSSSCGVVVVTRRLLKRFSSRGGMDDGARGGAM